MKKINSLTRLFLILVTCLYSLETVSGETKKQLIEQLIEDDLEDNVEKIKTLSESIKIEQRQRIYLKYEQAGGDANISALINYFPGFGLGSYAQGDMTGGFLLTLGHVASVTMIIIGAVQSSRGQLNSLVWVGVFTGGVTATIGLVRPFVFRISYNKLLRQSLHGYYEPSHALPSPKPSREYMVRVNLGAISY